MIKGYGYILAALFWVSHVGIVAEANLGQNDLVKNFSNTSFSSYNYTDYALIAGAAYLMYLSSYFLVRDAAIAMYFGYLDPYDIDRMQRFLGYIPEHLLKLLVIGGLTYKTLEAHKLAVEKVVQE